MVTHAVDYTREDKFATTELDLFLGKEFIVTFHRTPLRSVSALIERLAKNAGPGPRGTDRIAHSLLDLLIDNYTPMLAERASDMFLWEGEMRSRVLTEVLSGTLQVRFQVYNYVAYMTDRYQSYANPGQIVSLGSVFTGASSNFNPLLDPVDLGF